jgi:hypothetical protein
MGIQKQSKLRSSTSSSKNWFSYSNKHGNSENAKFWGALILKNGQKLNIAFWWLKFRIIM